jgi:SH3 domain-containing YSC84-like protein 1
LNKTTFLIFFSVFLLITGSSVIADDRMEAEGLVNDSLVTLTNFINDPETSAFREQIQHAKGILIIPSLIKAGFGIGGSGGSGVLLRLQTDKQSVEQWSNPAFYGMGSITLGLQIGGEVAEVILLVMKDKGMDALLSNKLQLGADASLAAGPTGIGTQVATVDILQYSRGKGLFGGLTVEGSVISPKEHFNSAYYGRPVSPLGILVQGVVGNPQTNNLRAKLASLQKTEVVTVSIVDADADGVPDEQDNCPNTPKGALVDTSGCWAFHGVFFDFDQNTIKPESQLLFDNALKVLNLNPGLTVEIQGHTDDVGPADYNLQLSESRAQAVKDYLVGHGIDPARLTIKGFGMSNPIVPNDSEEGRAYNRRVYFKRTDL